MQDNNLNNQQPVQDSTSAMPESAVDPRPLYGVGPLPENLPEPQRQPVLPAYSRPTGQVPPAMPRTQGYPSPPQQIPMPAAPPYSPYNQVAPAGGNPYWNNPLPVQPQKVPFSPIGAPTPEAQKAPSSEKPAGMLPRLAAYLFDCLLAWGISLILFALLRSLGLGSFLSQPLLFVFSGRAVLRFVLLGAYFSIMTAVAGATPGKKLMRLRVVQQDGEKLSWINAVYRETAGRILTAFLFIGYLFMAVDPAHRGFHDMLCDTRVVYDL